MKNNLSNIARRANALTATMNQSAAWKRAWAEAKISRLEKAMYLPENGSPACWMPIREELFTVRAALAAIIKEAEAANPAMQREALERNLFCLKMADRPSYDERQEITRLERLLAA